MLQWLQSFIYDPEGLLRTYPPAQHRQGHRSPDSHILVPDSKELPSQNGTLLALGTASNEDLKQTIYTV